MSRTLPIAALILIAAVSSASGTARPRATEDAGLAEAASRGLVFAGQRCAECHAVAAGRNSANPEAPSFEDIANRPGVTAATLHDFLRDSHNYPQAMDFRVEPSQLRDLADYIATLRTAAYHPDI